MRSRVTRKKYSYGLGKPPRWQRSSPPNTASDRVIVQEASRFITEQKAGPPELQARTPFQLPPFSTRPSPPPRGTACPRPTRNCGGKSAGATVQPHNCHQFIITVRRSVSFTRDPELEERISWGGGEGGAEYMPGTNLNAMITSILYFRRTLCVECF